MLQKIKSFLFENKTDKQTIMKNTFWLMLAEGVSKGGMFLITILIARILGPEQFGILSFVMSFVAMFIVITDFGLTTLMVREVSRDHSKIKDYLVNLSFLKVILGVITFILVWIVSHFIGKDSFYITLILIYCGYAIINNFGEFIRAFFRPSEKMQYEALLKIINGVLMLGIVLYALFVYGDLESILYGYLIAGVISLVISLVYVGKKFDVGKLKLNNEVIRDSLKSGVYLMGGMLAVSMFNYIDQIMIGILRTEKELGYYGAIYGILISYIGIILLFGNVIYPKLNNYIYNKEKLFLFIKKIITRLFLFVIIFICFNFILNSFIINLFLGWKYVNKSTLFSYNILIFSIIPIFFSVIFGKLLIILHYEKLFLYIVLLAMFLNILLNYYFIINYGIIGASTVTLFTESLVGLLYYIFFIKLYNK